LKGGDQVADTAQYRVVVNGEGRHSLWPAGRALVHGWREVSPPAPRADCLEYITRHWRDLDAGRPRAAPSLKTIDFSLMFFGSDEGSAAREKYEMVIEAARQADASGFSAVWVPERHFTRMGSLYPNPAVLHAALARETKNIRLRSGSVVLPLHNPLRVAEEWAVVDNLSGGRVELSFAPGWNTEDFALAPDCYARRYELLYEGVQTVRRLWRGESVEVVDGAGKRLRVRTYPTPVQAELPAWITAAGSPKSFEMAGQLGCHLLTHLFDQDVEELARKIGLYRAARERHGHPPQAGRVAVTLHTFVGETMEDVQRLARGPYANYLKSNIGLLQHLAHSRGVTIDLAALPESQLQAAVEWMFEKFLHQRSLLTTPEAGADLVGRLIGAGAQEVACLVDFGPSPGDILGSLPLLARLKDRFRAG
jgi:natural product biosynthesis luciferase-like monooxygenase protein